MNTAIDLKCLADYADSPCSSLPVTVARGGVDQDGDLRPGRTVGKRSLLGSIEAQRRENGRGLGFRLDDGDGPQQAGAERTAQGVVQLFQSRTQHAVDLGRILVARTSERVEGLVEPLSFFAPIGQRISLSTDFILEALIRGAGASPKSSTIAA